MSLLSIICTTATLGLYQHFVSHQSSYGLHQLIQNLRFGHIILSSIMSIVIVLFHYLILFLFQITGLSNKLDLKQEQKKTNRLSRNKLVSNSNAMYNQASNDRLFHSYSYRFEEYATTTNSLRQRSSNEYAARGKSWFSHPSWHLPNAPKHSYKTSIDFQFHLQHQSGMDHVLSILRKYDVDPLRGFLPSQDPLQRLPHPQYLIWEDLADDLPKLLCARLGQARDPLNELPVVSIDKLETDRELRRAHLLLCLFAHSFIWGGTEPLDYLPEGIAKPLWAVSESLGLPPVLGHPSIVLNNWRRFDLKADICMENISTLNNFFDGRDESWFYLITVEIEAKGAAAILPMMLAIDAIKHYNEDKRAIIGKISLMISTIILLKIYYLASQAMQDEDEQEQSIDNSMVFSDEELVGSLDDYRIATFVTLQLQKVASAVRDINQSLANMKEGCHPFIFYHRVRPFLSGWKQNPTLPNGIIYRGVDNNRYQFYGGSAAQSALIPFLDIGLGISHDSTRSKDFLLAMRDYMVRPHREFLSYFETVACIRPFVIEILEEKLNSLSKTNVDSVKKVWLDLRVAYDACVEAVKDFRSGHMTLVADYIMAQQIKSSHNKKLEGSAGGKGTGGTDLMNFLKPIRDNCKNR